MKTNFSASRCLTVFGALLFLSSCGLIPTGVSDESNIKKENYPAYGSLWKNYTVVKKQNTYSIQGDTWDYLALAQYLENDKGIKVDFQKDIYILQKSGIYKPFNGSKLKMAGLSTKFYNNKIYVGVYERLEDLTDCYAYYLRPDTPKNTQDQFEIVAYGELDSKTGRFLINMFSPVDNKILRKTYLKYKGHLYADQKFNTFLPFYCDQPLDQQKILADFKRMEKYVDSIPPPTQEQRYEKDSKSDDNNLFIWD